MHLLKKDNLLGTYAPAFYYIFIKTDKDLSDLPKLNDSELNTFIHEYTHFLQDILTIYGLRNIIQVTQVLKTLINELKVKSGEINLPIVTIKNEVLVTNIDLISYYYGDSEVKYSLNTVEKYEVHIDEIINPQNKEILKIPYIILKVYHTAMKNKIVNNFHFGVISIIESMAFLIESSIKSTSNPPFVPYRIVEMVARDIMPKVKWSKAMLVALCEISMQAFNPAHKFIDILDRMKEHKCFPQNVDDIFKFCEGYTVDNKSPKELSEELLRKVKKELVDFLGSKYLEDSKNWYEKIMTGSEELISNNFSFAKLIENKNPKDIKLEYDEIITRLGYPLMSNSKDQYWADYENQIIFRVILESYSILTDSKHKSCGLYNYCSSRKKDVTCSDCSVAPWKRAKDGKDCALTTLWKIWGIDHLEFKK